MKRKNKWLTVILILVVFGSFQVGRTVGASSSEPGSAGDPLVSQSYLEKRLQESSTGSKNSQYSKVTLNKNRTIKADMGTEIIVYSGSATVVGSNGLINLSTGEMFAKGNSAVKYNVFLAPAKGNGIKALSTTSLFVKGSYSIS